MKRIAGKVFSAFGFTQLVMIAAIGFALYSAYEPWRWGKVRDELLRRFPAVDHIDGTMLERWIRDARGNAEKQGPLLLDVRTDSEFAVSHLPGARRVGVGASPDEMGLFTDAEKRDADFRRPIVLYCAVGYESSEVGERLKRLGFTRVQMLEGGIFRWANEGRPLEGAPGSLAKTVHPGTSPNAQLLKRSLRLDTF